MELEVINPATEKVIGKVAADNKNSIERKYKAARAAQPAWQKLGLKSRLEI